MDGRDVAFGLLVVLIAGATVVGKLFGPRADRNFERAFWVAVAGVIGGFVGLVLLGLIWSTIRACRAATARSRSSSFQPALRVILGVTLALSVPRACVRALVA
jgi:hypothetical protein